MVTVEQDQALVEYSNVMRGDPYMAAHIYCWDSIASVIAQLDELPEDGNRNADWILQSLDERTEYLINEVPGLSSSPAAEATRALVESIGRSVIAYKSLLNQAQVR